MLPNINLDAVVLDNLVPTGWAEMVDIVPIQHRDTIIDMPPKKKAQRTRLIQKCSETIKTINDLVYNMKDINALNVLLDDLSSLKEKVLLQVPKDGGLIIQDSPRKTSPPTDCPFNNTSTSAIHLAEVTKAEVDDDAREILQNLSEEHVGQNTTTDKRKLPESITALPAMKYGRTKTDKRLHYGNPHVQDHWVEVEGIRLTQDEKEDFRAGGWLDDRILDAAQKLVSSEFPLL